jgi:hypothetical protein
LDSLSRNNLADEKTSPILPERMEPRLQNKTKENCQSNVREFAGIFLVSIFNFYVFLSGPVLYYNLSIIQGSQNV